MSEQTLPKEWQSHLNEIRAAKIKQANALESQARAIRQEVASLAKMAQVDNESERAV